MRYQLMIPIAGLGKRFEGFHDPKPFINVGGAPMVEGVVADVDRAFRVPRFTLLLPRQQHQNYARFYGRCRPGTYFHYVYETTRGPTETCLLGEEYFRPEEALLVANCSQRFRASALLNDNTVTALTYRTDKPDQEYLLPNGSVTPDAGLGRWATAGVFLFREASTFFDAARKAVEAGQFTLASVLNYLPSGSSVQNCAVNEMHSLSNPAELSAYRPQ